MHARTHGLPTLLLFVLACSCQSGPPPISEGAEFDTAAGPAPIVATRIAPGSTVSVRFVLTPELDEEQRVRPDGTISLALVGDVEVAGLTPREVRKTLLERYASKLVEPQINVVLRETPNRRVYVGGQVNRPGSFEISGPMTALEAVLLAGGPDIREADVSSVIVVRHNEHGRKGFRVDLGKSLRGEPVNPFYLRPTDVVYVPQSTIAAIDQWVDQHINKLVPQFGMVFTKPIGGGATIGIENRR